LTTLEQRNIFTTVSSNGLSSWSKGLAPSGGRAKGGALSAGASLSTGSTGLTGSTANLFSKLYSFSFSKSQPGFSGRFGKSLDSAMKLVPVSIKTNALNTDAESLLGNNFAYRFSGLLVAGVGQLLSQRLYSGACRGKRRSGGIINNLGVNMSIRAKHRQPGPVRGPKDLLPNVIFAPDCCFS